MKIWTWTARALLGAALLVATAWPAQAAWVRAETDKFIVYGQGGEKSVRDFAVKLTTFDTVLRIYNPAAMARKPATKVQVFLLPSTNALKRVRPKLGRYVLGFYSANNEGVFAFAVKADGFGADDVLFHEYAHHFMLENFPTAYPAWFVEGWAEYFMTADIKDRVVKVGGYNLSRAYGILGEVWLPLDEVLSKTTSETKSSRVNVYYAQAWLLVHYMLSDPGRAAQLDTAIKAISKGDAPVKAIETATGKTLQELTAELRAYKRLPSLTLTLKDAPAPEIKIAPLSPSADDLLLDEMRLMLAFDYKPDTAVLEDVRRKAAKYPGDALAERTLARAEFTWGDVAAGEAIMQRRLAANPNDAEDLVLAGYGQLNAGYRDPGQRDSRFRAARPHLMKAYQLNKTDFRALYGYGVSRTVEAAFPNDNDLNALLETRYLAPAVQENAMRAGLALLAKGRREEAARILAPVINNPHGGAMAERARTALNGGGIGPLDLKTPDDEAEAEPEGPAKPAT